MAAEMRAFTISHDRTDDMWTFAGTAVVANRYQLAQKPLELIVPTKAGAWRYRVLVVEVMGTTIRGIVVPMRRPEAGPAPRRIETEEQKIYES